MHRGTLLALGVRSSLILLTVLLTHLSLPGGPLPLLGLVSFVPLALALHGASPRAACGYAYACAVLGWLVSSGGLAVAFSSYTQSSSTQGVLAVAALCAWLALPYALFGLAYGQFQWMRSPAGFLKAAAGLTLCICGFPTPLPIDSSHALYEFPILIQILDVGGQPLLLFALYVFNWAVADTVLRLHDRRRPGPALATLLALALLMPAYGQFRLTHFRGGDVGDPLTVAVMQPNIPLGGDSEPHSSDALNPYHTLIDMSEAFLSGNTSVDLVVWPETPLRITCEDEFGIRPQLIFLAARFGVPLLINCVHPATTAGDFNTQLLVSPDGGSLAYYKHRLLPFAEFLPWEGRFPVLRRIFPSVSHYVPSDKDTVFHIARFPGIVMAICYEILFPAHVRRMIERGGRILVTPSNDAWFGESRIADFLVAQGVFQAIEHRVPVVRVSNSGNCTYIQTSGEIAPGSRTPVFTRMTALYTVRAQGERSPYSYLGDVFLYLLAAVFLIGLFRDLKTMAGQRS